MQNCYVWALLGYKKYHNIAGRLQENSRDSFVDLQSETVKKTDQDIVFSLKAEMLYFDQQYVKVIAASTSCS